MTGMSKQRNAATEIMSAINEFICVELLQMGTTKLTEDTPLIEDGYITSLQAVELVLFLEEKFHIEIPPEEVTEEEFKNLRTLTALVQEKSGEAP